ncbi:MAG TPA: bifunctional DNA-formamidopyrimidine glycosylase/DNA-(apurinic or apyrimidinic site) lyase, partial [Myxococcota bacterium]|nr:bifunctional DNA-formamidopyrimidine glycosylase/DNA-(apurinic or apyrimidinic site) lyase [Myxococcota bacterium]
MPELPEVETVRRSLLPHVLGARIDAVRVADGRLRWPVDVPGLTRAVAGRRITGVRRRAKYLLFDLEAETVLMVHLGMTGRLGIVPADRLGLPHDHVIFELEGARQMRFNDARRFGLVEVYPAAVEAEHPRLKHLGVEPLDATAFTGASLQAGTRGVKKPIKNFLMDAAQVVGVGNIYASESLFAARIRPTLPAGRLSRPRCDRLVDAVRATLEHAIAQGGTTLRDFQNAEGEAGYFAIAL